jgi:hypothetical protein
MDDAFQAEEFSAKLLAGEFDGDLTGELRKLTYEQLEAVGRAVMEFHKETNPAF